jgi:competence protein ComEC
VTSSNATGPGLTAAGVDLRLVPAALTAWAATATGILWHVAAAAAVVVIATTAAACASIRLRDSADERARPWWPAVAVGVIGAAFACSVALRVDHVEHHPIADRIGDTVSVTAVPVETPRVVAGSRVMFRAVLRAVDGHPQAGRVLVFASVVGYGDVTAGRPAEFRARVGKPARRDLTVAVLSATGEAHLGEAGAVHRVAAAVRRDFAETARAVLPSEQAAMLPALTLGDTSAVAQTTVADFRTAGLAHLTAVSGANVTIVCGTVLLSAMVVGPRIAVALASIALVAFVVVVQPTASVLRAAIMGAVTLLAVVSHRRRQAIPALAATILVVLIGWPEMAVDVGFALSVSATAALVLIAPAWSAALVARRWPKPLADAVCVAVAAQLITAPLVAGISGAFSIVAVFANLAVTIVIAPITVLGTAAAAICSAWPDAAGAPDALHRTATVVAAAGRGVGGIGSWRGTSSAVGSGGRGVRGGDGNHVDRAVAVAMGSGDPAVVRRRRDGVGGGGRRRRGVTPSWRDATAPRSG